MPHASPSKSLPFADRERLSAAIAPVARAHGAEIWDIELKNESGWVLRIYVERLGAAENKWSTKDAAVDLEMCAAIARDLSHTLDVEDPIPCRYNLEVSSPGIERSLKSEADYVRFAGEKAKLKLRSAVRGQKVFTGRLGPVSGGTVMLEDGDRSVTISLEDVTSARLVFDFGFAPKPRAKKDLRRRRRIKV